MVSKSGLVHVSDTSTGRQTTLQAADMKVTFDNVSLGNFWNCCNKSFVPVYLLMGKKLLSANIFFVFNLFYFYYLFYLFLYFIYLFSLLFINNIMIKVLSPVENLYT